MNVYMISFVLFVNGLIKTSCLIAAENTISMKIPARFNKGTRRTLILTFFFFFIIFSRRTLNIIIHDWCTDIVNGYILAFPSRSQQKGVSEIDLLKVGFVILNFLIDTYFVETKLELKFEFVASFHQIRYLFDQFNIGFVKIKQDRVTLFATIHQGNNLTARPIDMWSKQFILRKKTINKLQIRLKFKLIVKMRTYQKPKILMNNTPIRNRVVNQQQTVVRNPQLTPTRFNKQNQNEHHLAVNNNNLSPNKLPITRKPAVMVPKQYNSSRPTLLQSKKPTVHEINSKMVSSRRETVSDTTCANHTEKQADFRIVIEGENMQYCGKCAAHLASQGFNVMKINKGVELAETKRADYLAPENKKLAGNPRYQQICEFLFGLKNLQKEFDENSTNFSRLNQHYNGQYSLIDKFYDAMVEYLKYIKNQHLNILRTESRKYIQIAQIECGQIEQNNMDIETIVTDIQDNIQSIVTDISQDKFRQCFNHYNQKYEMYKHRIQEQRTTFEEVTDVPHQELEIKLQEFRNTVNDLFGIKQSNNNRLVENESKKNLLRNPNEKKQKDKNTNQHPKGPFRNLFEQQDGLPDQSPQFKNI